MSTLLLTELMVERLPSTRACEGRISTGHMADNSSTRIDLLQGTFDMLILRTLLLGPAHGHQIAKHIRSTTADVLPAGEN